MSQLTERILRATKDLQAIQDELSRAAASDASAQLRDDVMNEMLQTQMVSDFKTAVDHMRHLLWSYIEATSTESKEDIAAKLQAVRMQRVTEMLKVLEPDVHQDATAALPGAQTFFDLIHNIAHSAMDRHQGGQHS
ncbi:MAG TPA: hypothetical protein VM056_06975 [Terriglobales bacterium]|nr:hypothetical protein [Terriglobales bacterium]